MEFRNFLFCTRHGMFDVRHFMLVGCMLMTGLLVLVSQSDLQARVLDPGAGLAGLANRGLHPVRTARIPLPARKTVPAKTAALPTIPDGFNLTILGDRKADGQSANLTRLASLRMNAPVTQFSPKARKSCSLEAARAAARGDTSKISPCIEALLSGDADAIVNLPEKMGAFFIEAMNDPNAAENMPNIMINSMMRMMEAMTGSSSTDEKTASVDDGIQK